MTTPLLRVEHLSVTHFDASAARPHDVSFSISRGEAVLLLGPSGCGKSTLARALNGLIPQSLGAEVTGRVLLADSEPGAGWHDVAELGVAAASQQVAMVFQDADAQIVTGQVFDEVAFGPENLRLPVPDIEERVERALRQLGLWDRREDSPDILSGGGRQRLAIASALAMGSPLLVLDEPTANLDQTAKHSIYLALGELVRAGTHGLLLIEHDLDEALTIATRVIVLDAEGRLAFDGTPREVFGQNAARLRELGVWFPVAHEAAACFTAAGWDLGPGPLPLLGSELARRLERVDRALLPDSSGSGAHRRELPQQSDALPITGLAGKRAPGEPAPRLETRALTVTRGRTRVLGPVSLSIQPGSITAVVGHNGAGKSSLLQALAGVRRAPRGTVLLDGQDTARMRAGALRTRVGYVFQNPEHQFLTHTVRDELAFEIERGAADAQTRVDEMLERFGLAEHADRHPFLLSGGQKRRLTVAAALLDGADVLVLDEPTFGQDRARAEELVALLRELHRDGATLVLATHDLQLVTELATHLLVLDGGVVAAHGEVNRVVASGALEAAGLGLPPLPRALAGVHRHSYLREITSVSQLEAALTRHPDIHDGGAS
ncbi:ABC transporter ATP-binding protein [Pseudoclavibacter sp. VKM Ac-2888]|uniref:ABC transporter ATP-binding protein n=1 Tax=Pseudoclavibacter sp. VKM Ac-2888 TaxID=2783830 RepID=UPI00188BC2AF|nr:ABC transporter ATP-binding protein [Pseudoclavibacter sp. VKM Ac-2888]MBF4550495.1 energy-coupling factor ABC transporter ATP-binding protein [Pseudoclavibacter sp. VKM Ac-2888]